MRVIYDDAGCLSLLPHNYAEMMRADGIRAFSFNRCVPVLNLVMNNRDHRKIMVIDGQIAFTGGVNLADEYINKIVRFGYWKDSGVRLDGPGAASLANIFLTFWKAKYPDEDLDAGCDLPAAVPVETDCLVQPFADTPVDREAVAKNVYLELINQAQKRLYICTPYLILDNDLLSLPAAGGQARRRCAHLHARRAGQADDLPADAELFPRICCGQALKFTATRRGFLHAKTWLVDDRIAAVGTVNLDYRSLYLHFENSVLLYGGAVLDDVRRDLAEIEKESAAVTLADCRTGFLARCTARCCGWWHRCAEGRGESPTTRGLPLAQTGTERSRPLPPRHPCMADRREGVLTPPEKWTADANAPETGGGVSWRASNARPYKSFFDSLSNTKSPSRVRPGAGFCGFRRRIRAPAFL